MVPKSLARALFFRSGFREQVVGEIEREQRRERKAAAKLEEQLSGVQAAQEAAEARLGKLTRRYDELAEKYDAAAELIERQIDRIAQLKEQLQALQSAQLVDRVGVLERVRQGDQRERVAAVIAELEVTFPVPALQAHLHQVISQSVLESDPYPHVILVDVLPEALHRTLYDARPPHGFWQSGQVGRENWTIGEDLGPLRTEAVWGYMDDVVVPRVFVPQLTALFTDYLRTLDSGSAEDAAASAALPFERSGGRLMLRRPGYHFEPHLDPHRAMLTGLMYFGTGGDSHDHGTVLYRSNQRVPEKHRGVYYPLQEGATCEYAKMVAARPNSMLVFASRVGLHGADIPADAQPPTLERYTYQFYVGRRRRK